LALQKGKTPTLTRRRSESWPIAYCYYLSLTNFPNHLHRAPVISELLAAIEADDVMAALAYRLPVGIAAGARTGCGEGLGCIAMTTAQRQDLQELLKHFFGPLCKMTMPVLLAQDRPSVNRAD